MQSQFERNAQRTAVKAVEDRLAHNERVQRQASRRRTLSNLGGWLVGLAVLVAIGYWFSNHSEGFGAMVGSAANAVSEFFSGSVKTTPIGNR